MCTYNVIKILSEGLEDITEKDRLKSLVRFMTTNHTYSYGNNVYMSFIYLHVFHVCTEG